uniref:NAD(P)/FAD-dependent oxidoreductase n=1 Tax=Bordetella sputigena TaxID=1416810 RepID=UPI0039F07A92
MRKCHLQSTDEPASAAAATRHRVVIVGGGAAGLELATRLGDQFHRNGQGIVTLIERARTHLWKPLIHAAAAGSLNPGEHELDYLAQAYWHHFKYQCGEMVGLDREAKEVLLGAVRGADGKLLIPACTVGYDTLVIAVGSMTNDFGTPGVAQHAIPLETPAQAERFHRQMIDAFLRAQSQDKAIEPGQLHLAIIGGGATGTELAAELHRTTQALSAFGRDRINPSDIRIILVEAAPRILPALPEEISAAATRLLLDRGVDVRTQAKVTEVRGDGILLDNGLRIPAELIVWAAGVRAPDFLRDLDGLESNRINQLVVTTTLQTTRDSSIFAIGDCAQCMWEGRNLPVPPRAQAAHQQAAHLFRQLQRRIAGKPLERYVYRDFGSLVNLGRYNTIGHLMGFLTGKNFRVRGLIARLMYRFLYAKHQFAIDGNRRTLLAMVARGFSRHASQQVKLH